MSAITRRAVLRGATLGFVAIQLPGSARAMIEMSRMPGVAVSGYDPVAYFVEGQPRLGSESITLVHEGVEWRFATVANRARFKANPTRYAPQYGGFCSWAVSQGYTAPADPEAWAIHEGKLFLNYDLAIRERWATDIPGHVAKANEHWPALSRSP